MCGIWILLTNFFKKIWNFIFSPIFITAFIICNIYSLSLLTCAYKNDSDYKVLINVPSRTLEVYEFNRVIKTYPVGLGRNGFPTPVGNFKVISKVRNPGWENPYKPAGFSRIKPGHNNPLGTRWIGFHRNKMGEYGMHGTDRPSSVGKYSSHGCVRMLVRHSEELFDIIDFNTPVKVGYYTHKVNLNGKNIVIKRYSNAYNRKLNPDKMIQEQLNALESEYDVDKKKLREATNMKNGNKLTIGKIVN